MAEIVCPSCHRRIRPPDHLAGRRVTCPRCEAAIVVPEELAQAVEEASAQETVSSTEEPSFPTSARLGILAMSLGMLSILILCLPFVGYLSIGLSSIGLVVGLDGWYHAWKDGSDSFPPVAVGGIGLWRGFGTRARDFPMAGVAACLFALTLALLPFLSRFVD